MLFKKINIVLSIFLPFVLISCASSPRFTSEKKIINENFTTPTDQSKDSAQTYRDNSTTYNDTAVLETQTGIASYYADKFNGKITYSGEVYNMYGITAAHPTYAMGTILRITNLKNGKSVVSRVNDRMPYNPDRIIDLSLGTAKKLDMVIDGLAEVQIEVLKFGEGK